MTAMPVNIRKELRAHAPFTTFGAVTGIVIMAVVIHTRMPKGASSALFWTFHPIHVFLGALVAAGMDRLHGASGVAADLMQVPRQMVQALERQLAINEGSEE